MQEQQGGKNTQGGLSWSTPSAASHNAAPHAHSTKQAPPPPKAPSGGPVMPSGVGKYAGMVVVGVLAGVLVAWGWSALRSASSGDAQNDTQKTATSTDLGVDISSTPALGSDPALTLMSPQASGTSVAVSKAIVSAPTWIVVYENKEGKPGNALGAALFFPERQSGTVELLRATVSGRSYLAVKQTDNGDRKFSLKDDPYLSEGSEVQWVTFEVR